MRNRTQEQLKAMFEQSRLEQQKKKKARQQQSLQRLKEIYRHQDMLLKKTLQERKRTTIENLSKLIKKTSQEVRKPLQNETYDCYQDKWELWETNEGDLYQSVEELKQAESRFEGKINWTVWDALVYELRKLNNVNKR